MKLVIGDYTVNITAAWTAVEPDRRATKRDTQAFLCMLSAMGMKARDAMRKEGLDSIAARYGRAADDIYDTLAADGYFSKRGL